MRFPALAVQLQGFALSADNAGVGVSQFPLIMLLGRIERMERSHSINVSGASNSPLTVLVGRNEPLLFTPPNKTWPSQISYLYGQRHDQEQIGWVGVTKHVQEHTRS